MPTAARPRPRPRPRHRPQNNRMGAQMTNPMHYGRDDDFWNAWIDAGLKFVVEIAKLGNVTTYTEVRAVLATRTGPALF